MARLMGMFILLIIGVVCAQKEAWQLKERAPSHSSFSFRFGLVQQNLDVLEVFIYNIHSNNTTSPHFINIILSHDLIHISTSL